MSQHGVLGRTGTLFLEREKHVEREKWKTTPLFEATEDSLSLNMEHAGSKSHKMNYGGDVILLPED